MTPKEKAWELVNAFTDKLFGAGYTVSFPMIKDCATLCVEQIIEGIEEVDDFSRQNLDRTLAWWESVKSEIDNLTALPGA